MNNKPYIKKVYRQYSEDKDRSMVIVSHPLYYAAGVLKIEYSEFFEEILVHTDTLRFGRLIYA